MALSVFVVGVIIWRCARDPQLNFLPPDHAAEWIVVPASFEARARAVATMGAVFHREFVLSDTPGAASITWRAARRAQLTINGSSVALNPTGNWKDTATLDVRLYLRAGTNDLEVKVDNDNAPPALCLALFVDGRKFLGTDSNWQVSCAGAAWRSAFVATDRHELGSWIAGAEQPLSALRAIWPVWLIISAAAAALLTISSRYFRDFGKSKVLFAVLGLTRCFG